MADAAVLRRSLSKGQKLAIVLEMDGLIKEVREKAKERSLANLKQGEIPADKTNWSNQKQGSTREVIAEKAGVGAGSVQRLTEVQRDAPDLFQQVKDGEMTP